MFSLKTSLRRRTVKIKDQGGTQSTYHFVFNSNSSKNKEILRLNNPQNNKLFYDLSRNKKIIDIVKKLIEER